MHPTLNVYFRSDIYREMGLLVIPIAMHMIINVSLFLIVSLSRSSLFRLIRNLKGVFTCHRSSICRFPQQVSRFYPRIQCWYTLKKHLNTGIQVDEISAAASEPLYKV